MRDEVFEKRVPIPNCRATSTKRVHQFREAVHVVDTGECSKQSMEWGSKMCRIEISIFSYQTLLHRPPPQ